MIKINENFLLLQNSYLFAEIARKVTAYKAQHPEADIIRMGIGDVTRPLATASIRAMHEAVDELTDTSTFRGYGPEQGYDFLRTLIVENDFKSRGVDIAIDEVFVSDGAKSDTANIVDIFDNDITIGVADPVYPVYIDSNVIAGRLGVFQNNRWSRLSYFPCNAENDFVPALPTGTVVDLIYLCYPNNPTGTTLTSAQLAEWVRYAREHGSIILFDAAYECFIREENVPHSIYEIEGARECAIEFRSFSKSAGFTGIRCGYTVVPHELEVETSQGARVKLNGLWNRRQTTKFNGASYISQRGAAAIYSEQGKAEARATIDYYLDNARTIRETLQELGYQVYGGVSSPYVWLKVPQGFTSWSFFDHLLQEKHIVSTPGVGFGPSGEGYIRLSSFGTREQTSTAMARFR